MSNWEKQYEVLANTLTDNGFDVPGILKKLSEQRVELPSWAVGNSGTRYGVFREGSAARHVWDKIDDCAEIQNHVGICSVMATHVSWDVTDDGDYLPVREYAEKKGLKIGTLHPNTFMGQHYKLGSICSISLFRLVRSMRAL